MDIMIQSILKLKQQQGLIGQPERFYKVLNNQEMFLVGQQEIIHFIK